MSQRRKESASHHSKIYWKINDFCVIFLFFCFIFNRNFIRTIFVKTSFFSIFWVRVWSVSGLFLNQIYFFLQKNIHRNNTKIGLSGFFCYLIIAIGKRRKTTSNHILTSTAQFHPKGDMSQRLKESASHHSKIYWKINNFCVIFLFFCFIFNRYFIRTIFMKTSFFSIFWVRVRSGSDLFLNQIYFFFQKKIHRNNTKIGLSGFFC